MWFWFSLIALLCWSGSDLFSKIGCSNGKDRYSHLKMLSAVGAVMFVHAIYQITVCKVELNAQIMLAYLPVSCIYIASMAIGYLGLRYIELSISSPICNSSGAIVAILSIATRGIKSLPPLAPVAILLVCAGVVALGITEATEDENLRVLRQSGANRKYSRSALAIVLPIVYCLLDALGTFADSIVLETMNEDSANCAYELTFFAVGLVCAIYTMAIKKQKPVVKEAAPRLVGACFETAGQLFYVYALADTEHVALSAPVISSYCVASMLWSRIFLKEKLSAKHYLSIGLTVAGIIILGVLNI